jgi:hypothetical protein
MSRKSLIFALKLLGTVVLCAMLYRAVPWHAVVASAAQIDLGILSVGLLLFVPQTLASAWRWRRMLRPLADVSFADALRQTLAANALNLVVPAKLGDFSKVAMVGDDPAVRKQAAVRAVLEKLGDVGMLLIAIGLGFLGLDVVQTIGLTVGFVLLLAVVRRLQSPSFDYAMWIGSTAMLWTMHLAQLHFFIRACGVDVTLATTLQRAPIALFAGLIPAAFCGIGTRDAALVWLFADVAPALTMAIVGMLTALRYLVPGAVGIPVLMSLRKSTQRAARVETKAEGSVTSTPAANRSSRSASRRPNRAAASVIESG